MKMPGQNRNAMDQTSDKKRRSNIRIAIFLGAFVLFWYVISMFAVLKS